MTRTRADIRLENLDAGALRGVFAVLQVCAAPGLGRFAPCVGRLAPCGLLPAGALLHTCRHRSACSGVSGSPRQAGLVIRMWR